MDNLGGRGDSCVPKVGSQSGMSDDIPYKCDRSSMKYDVRRFKCGKGPQALD